MNKVIRVVIRFKGIDCIAPHYAFIDHETNHFFDEITLVNPLSKKEVRVFRTKMTNLAKRAVIYEE